MTQISRRTIAKGAAWSVPAVAVAASAPALALSAPALTGLVVGACKQPGGSCENDYGFIKGYVFVFRIDNPSGVDAYIYGNPAGYGANAWDGNPVNPTAVLVSDPPKTWTYTGARVFTPGSGNPIGDPLLDSNLVPAGGSIYIIVNAGTNDDSSQTSITGTVDIAWGHTMAPGADTSHSYANFSGDGWIEIGVDFPSVNPCTACSP